MKYIHQKLFLFFYVLVWDSRVWAYFGHQTFTMEPKPLQSQICFFMELHNFKIYFVLLQKPAYIYEIQNCNLKKGLTSLWHYRMELRKKINCLGRQARPGRSSCDVTKVSFKSVVCGGVHSRRWSWSQSQSLQQQRFSILQGVPK